MSRLKTLINSGAKEDAARLKCLPVCCDVEKCAIDEVANLA